MLKSRLGFARADSLRATPIFNLLAAASLAIGVGALGHSLQPSTVAQAVNPVMQAVRESASAQALTKARNEIASTVGSATLPQPIVSTRDAELDEGQTFASLLIDAGASETDAQAAMNALSKVYDLRKLKAGQDVSLTFSRTAEQETLIGAEFQPEDTKEVSVGRAADNSYTAVTKLIPVVRQRIAARGDINSSLYEAGAREGVPRAVMAALIRIYSHDIDFQRDIHSGDKFEVLYDQPVTASGAAQGKPVGEGDVIYAALTVGGKIHPIYRVTFSDHSVEYFDDKGQSTRRALLRTPVAAAHITSSFGMRMHPLLGYSKMHKGVDFGAPTGTPIFAAGSGTVNFVGMKNGYGRFVEIRHNGSLETAYAHMSRFASNLYRGARVNQGQVIGYVGMSGRATGPHLHFEVHMNGNQVNPLAVNMKTGRTLTGKLLADFRAGQTRIRQEFTTIMAKKAPAQPAPMVTTKGPLIQAGTTERAFIPRKVENCGQRSGC